MSTLEIGWLLLYIFFSSNTLDISRTDTESSVYYYPDVCVCDFPLTLFLLMNPPVMQNSVCPQCHWLQGRHGNTISRINDSTATCHCTAGMEREGERAEQGRRECVQDGEKKMKPDAERIKRE